MHRLALFAIIALFFPTHAAAQCPAPDYWNNTACFDPHGGMAVSPAPRLPSGRYRVFSLNGPMITAVRGMFFGWLMVHRDSEISRSQNSRCLSTLNKEGR